MFKKIGRFLGNIAKGAVKAVPLYGLVEDIVKGGKSKNLEEVGEKIKAKIYQNKNIIGSAGTEKSNVFYEILDIIDDGKANNSYSKELSDKILQGVSGLLTAISVIIYIINNL